MKRNSSKKAAASASESKYLPFQPQYVQAPARRSKTWRAEVSPLSRPAFGKAASASSSAAERQRKAGTASSSIRFNRAGTPALRKYFCASTSAATWLQAEGTSIHSCEKTIDPSGLRISLFVVRNAISA